MTRNKNRPSVMGPTGISFVFFYSHTERARGVSIRNELKGKAQIVARNKLPWSRYLIPQLWWIRKEL